MLRKSLKYYDIKILEGVVTGIYITVVIVRVLKIFFSIVKKKKLGTFSISRN